MKNFLIYQYFCKSNGMYCDVDSTDYYQLSHQSIQKYCLQHNIDYELFDNGHKITPFYGIFVPFCLNHIYNYDAICFIDSDILATKNSINVFDYYHESKITANIMDLGHANTGVVIFPKSFFTEIQTNILDKLEDMHDKILPIMDKYGPFDQYLINKFYLPDKINNLPKHMNWVIHRYGLKNRFEKSLIHYNMAYKSHIHKDFVSDLILK